VPPPQSVQLLGTGSYLQTKGGLATAAHVAEEAQQLLAANPDSVGIAHTLPTGRTGMAEIVEDRLIEQFVTHPLYVDVIVRRCDGRAVEICERWGRDRRRYD
jgi:hypothetical protein